MESLDVGILEAAGGILLGLLALVGTLGVIVYRAVLGKKKSRGIRRTNQDDLAEAKATHAAVTEEAEAKIRDGKEEAEVKLKALEEVLNIEDKAERADALTALHNKNKDREA